MSSGRKSSLVAQVWAQLTHVTVMIVMPFTSSVQPTCRHLGQWIGRWRSVLGIDGLAFPISGTQIVIESGRTKKPKGSICLAQQWLLSDEGATNGKRIEPIER